MSCVPRDFDNFGGHSFHGLGRTVRLLGRTVGFACVARRGCTSNGSAVLPARIPGNNLPARPSNDQQAVHSTTGIRGGMPGWGEKFATLEEQTKWAVLFAIVLSALTAARDVVSMLRPGEVDDWVWSFAAQLTLFLYWAFLTP